MAGRFEGTAVIDRPIEEVFAFLADGENDPKFSPRVLEIAKATEGRRVSAPSTPARSRTPGMKTKREFKLTAFDPPTRIHWAEVSKNLVTAPEGGCNLAREGNGTRVTIHNVLEGHGPGKLIAPLALRSARKGADDFAKAIKRAVEAS
jgi:hypothetical protein